MKYSSVQLMNLPDEILLMIFKKLTNQEVLYSLMGINMQLNQIIGDPSFTNQISLLKCKSSDNVTSTLPDIILDRFCLQILPQIHGKIKWLNLETLSMERILLASDYPNLRQLSIFSMNEETDIQFFSDGSRLIDIFEKFIVTLHVNGKRVDSNRYRSMSTLANLFSNIILIFANLLHLKFYSSDNFPGEHFSFVNQTPRFYSSTLVELHVNVYCFDDCLYLLDGRLPQLHTLFVQVFQINSFYPPTIMNKERIPNLKCFSWICFNDLNIYDEVVVHLHRMINLEKLILYLVIVFNETFIDGTFLNETIINHLPHLREFLFNIHSKFWFNDQTPVLSNEDIQRTFTDFKENKVISSIDYFPKDRTGQCHLYSNPYTIMHYNGITNHFPGGLFNCVIEITLFDEHPFEHEFFMRIAKAFPFLKNLSVTNFEAQKYKEYSVFNDENAHLPIIEYPNLICLDLLQIHDDYAEQFLFDRKTSFLNDIFLLIHKDVLQRVTRNLTRDATRNNYSKIKRLYLDNSVDLSKYC